MTNEEAREILTERQDGVVQIRLQRPDKKNALTLGMYAGLTAALTEAEHDPTVRVAVLTNSLDSTDSLAAHAGLSRKRPVAG
ncbi:MAG: hypothetical protein LCH89_12635 [Proteobacteria bacterium]|nr:hypothetical protein [Pseudomonadota bacterium]